MRRFLSLFVILGVLAACEETPTAYGPADNAGMEKAATAGKHWSASGLLPAHRLPWEVKVPGKEDANTDYQKAHPQWYAITQPPTGKVRPMKEWEPMQANIITYSNDLPSSPDFAQVMVDIVVGSLPYVEMWIVVDSEVAKADLINRLKNAGITQAQIDQDIKWLRFQTNAFWVIDYGPLPLVNEDTQTVAFGDFRYYPNRVLDDAIPTRMGNALNTVTYRAPFDYEGGNFQADGDQFCYFSERVYMYTGMSYDDVNDVMRDYFGCQQAVVLKDITNDGTGHIDMFFKLGGKHVAVVGEYTVVSDAANEQRMDDNVAILESLVYDDTAEGITVYRVPMPNAGWDSYYKEWIPRTFINSTLITAPDGLSGVNLWPMYTVDKELEAQALAVWEQALPNFDHVGVISDEVSLASGAVHCVTRTIPALPLAKWVPDGECVDGKCEGAGYDGACLPMSEETPGCWGPKWACLCSDCTNATCQVPATCGDGTCDATEGCFKCPADCACEAGLACYAATNTCKTDTCGNGVCDPDETCTVCEKDCGCEGGKTCAYGICVSDGCAGISDVGCCDGEKTLVYCDGGSLTTLKCTSRCGWSEENSWYDCGTPGEADPAGKYPLECKGNYDFPPGCAGKVCGDNGGGYSCGECAEGLECVEGACQGACVPACDGKVCGDDGCGKTCGECDAGEECSATFTCEKVCVPVCDGKDCGPDGCDGECGTCGEGLECGTNGVCEAACTPQCDGKECGLDGCGGECGTCAEGKACSEAGLCVAECTPVCDGKACGDDGCGGVCGTCADGTTCAEGICEEEPAAGGDDDGGCSMTTSSSRPSNGLGLLLAGLFLLWAFVRRQR